MPHLLSEHLTSDLGRPFDALTAIVLCEEVEATA
jgi:hypothetical protein